MLLYIYIYIFFFSRTPVWKHLVCATGHCMSDFPHCLTLSSRIASGCFVWHTVLTLKQSSDVSVCVCVCVCVGGWMTVSSVTSRRVWSVTGRTLTRTPKRWPSVWCSRRAANSTSASYGRPSWELAGRSRSPWVSHPLATVLTRTALMPERWGLMVKDLGC